MKLVKTCLVLSLMIIFGLSGCWYQMDDDENGVGPDGTGVQGVWLTTRVVPSTLSADGVAKATLELRFRNLEDGTGVPNAKFYISLWQMAGGAYAVLPHDVAYFTDTNSSRSIIGPTDDSGLAYASIQTSDAWANPDTWEDVDQVDCIVFVEPIEPWDRSDIFYEMKDTTVFIVVNPYL